MSSIRANVVAAKARLAQGYEDFKRLHQEGCSGVELCAKFAGLRDAVLLDLIRDALADLNESGPGGLLSQIALVANGGYGRREVAPFSDVDLQILYPLGLGGRVAPFAERLLRDVFDAGLILGHGVRTPEQTCRQAMTDPDTCTSLVQYAVVGRQQAFVPTFPAAVPQAGKPPHQAVDRPDRAIQAGGTPPLRRHCVPAGAGRKAFQRRLCATSNLFAGLVSYATAPPNSTNWRRWES